MSLDIGMLLCGAITSVGHHDSVHALGTIDTHTGLPEPALGSIDMHAGLPEPKPSCCQDSEVMLLEKISNQNMSYGRVLSLVTVLTVL